MAVRELTLAIPDVVMDALNQAAASEGITLERLLQQALRLGLVATCFEPDSPDGVYIHQGNRVRKVVMSKDLEE
jgi:hypothetical protein